MRWGSGKRRRFGLAATLLLNLSGLTALSATLLAAPHIVGQANDHEHESTERGQELYRVQCAYCHGRDGKGDGEASHLLFPRPRNLTSGQFTLRSTPAGSPPTDEDIFRTISRGIPGSGMPSFRFLAGADRRSLVLYVKSLSPVFSKPAAEKKPPLDLSTRPPAGPGTVAAGEKVYRRAGCAACHGAEGKGDGEGARDLEDDTGLPITVRNLTTGPFKGGTSVQDIYLRIATGMEGTPMRVRPGVSEQERWQLAYYVKSLCKLAACNATLPDGTPMISARGVRRLPLSDPFATAWNKAPQVMVPLNALWNRGTVPPDLVVRALHDDHTIAFLLEWNDSTKDVSTVKPEDFSDAVAMEFFSGKGSAKLAMGDPETQVTLWQWKADWQEHMDRAKRAGPADAHPWMVDDGYPLPSEAALQAGNQRSLLLRSSPVEEAIARGFGRVMPKPLERQLASGKGVWRAGRWHVVLSRTLAADSGISTVPGATKLGFAVWNGNVSERAGQKAISTWYTLILGK
jgi:mono/diheme cytochrome c family protein